VVNELRRELNERTLRAFRYADRFTTLKIFRQPGALRGLTNQLRVFSLPFWPFQLNSRIESQLRSYRESEAILVFRGNVTMLLPF
jgi:hypothetical protein